MKNSLRSRRRILVPELLSVLLLVTAPVASAQRGPYVNGNGQLGVGVALPADWTFGTRNPAGLQWVRSEQELFTHAEATGTAETLDASHLLRDSRDSFESYVSSGTTSDPSFVGDLRDLQGEIAGGQAWFTPYGRIRAGQAFFVVAGVTKSVEFVDTRASNLLLDFRHTARVGMGWSASHDVSGMGPGRLAVGYGLFAGASQSLRENLTSPSAIDQYLGAGHFRAVFRDVNPELEYTAILGGQWRTDREVLGPFHVSLGLVAQNLVASSPTGDLPVRVRGGVALVSPRRFVPELAIDVGSYDVGDRHSRTVIGAALGWTAGPFALGAGVRPGARSVSASVCLVGVEFGYRYVNRFGDREHFSVVPQEHAATIGVTVPLSRSVERVAGELHD